MKETVDKTAMQTAYNEGFCDGVAALLDSIDELDLMEDDGDEPL